MTDPQIIATIRSRVAAQREDLIQFLRDLCAIPSYDSQIRAVGERAEAEMRKLGFDEVWLDQTALRQPHRHSRHWRPR
jgi:hypothetical protein